MIGELVLGYQALFCCCSVMSNCEVIANGHGKQLNFGKLYKCSNDHLIFSPSVQRTPHTKKLSQVPASETTVPPYSKVGKTEFSSCDYPNNAKTDLCSYLSLAGRCAILEPGPVTSSIIGNVEAWTKKYDRPTTDPKTTEIFQTFEQRFNTAFDENMVQSGSEVAEIVKNIILSEKPNLRYHTNKKFNPEQVKAKLSDPTGNVLVDLMNKTYIAKE